MKRLCALSLIVIVVPFTTYAVWWKPTDWFKEEPIVVSTSTQTAIQASTTVSKPTVVIKEVPVIKTVEKVVQVDNPLLQTQINALTYKNTQLQLTINDLTIKLNKATDQSCPVIQVQSSNETISKAIRLEIAQLDAFEYLVMNASSMYQIINQLGEFRTFEDNVLFPNNESLNSSQVMKIIEVERVRLNLELVKNQ